MASQKMGLDNRVRSSELKKIILDIKIRYIKQNMKPPTEEKIVNMLIKKYNIKQDILIDRFIEFKR